MKGVENRSTLRVALTGGASGIGAEVATKLTEAGHHVTAFDISEPAVPVGAWIETDLSSAASIDAAIDRARGPYDALINNAGLPPRAGLAETILNVNFIGFRQFYTRMLDRLADGAAIVNTASRAGAFWRDNLDDVKALLRLQGAEALPEFIALRNIDHVRAYNLSKEAVIAFTLAQTEALLARGLRANSVSPAAVSTGILDDFVAAFGPKVAANIARVGRPGTPEEVADLIVYLASPQSAWLKGVDITIDGGMSALAATDMFRLNG